MQVSQLSDYDILEVIGNGSFARCSKVMHKSTKQIYVWKELEYGQMSDKEKQMLVDEVNILRGLHHPNIVRYYDRIIDHSSRTIYIIQEHCDAGDLAMLIKDHKFSKKVIPEDFIWSVLSEIASALYACHRKEKGARVLHRDLKPGNIFLSSIDGRPDKSWSNLSGLSVKLGDFGLARVLHDQSVFAQTHVGTPYYMSPEQVQYESYDEKSDIWALGCILYEMGTLQPPFRAERYTQLARKIQKGEYRDFGNISKELATLISQMLKVKPAERPSISQILNLPRVQLTAKKIQVERRYLSAKKHELLQRRKEREIKEWSLKLKREQNRLHEKEKSLQEQKLELERHQHRLSSVEHILRNQARAKGITLPICNSRNTNFGLGNAPGGGVEEDKSYRKGSGGSSSTIRSRSQSFGSKSIRSSLERRSMENLDLTNSKSPGIKQEMPSLSRLHL